LPQSTVWRMESGRFCGISGMLAQKSNRMAEHGLSFIPKQGQMDKKRRSMGQKCCRYVNMRAFLGRRI